MFFLRCKLMSESKFWIHKMTDRVFRDFRCMYVRIIVLLVFSKHNVKPQLKIQCLAWVMTSENVCFLNNFPQFHLVDCAPSATKWDIIQNGRSVAFFIGFIRWQSIKTKVYTSVLAPSAVLLSLNLHTFRSVGKFCIMQLKLKTLDTIGICRRQVFPLGVSEHYA